MNHWPPPRAAHHRGVGTARGRLPTQLQRRPCFHARSDLSRQDTRCRRGFDTKARRRTFQSSKTTAIIIEDDMYAELRSLVDDGDRRSPQKSAFRVKAAANDRKLEVLARELYETALFLCFLSPSPPMETKTQSHGGSSMTGTSLSAVTPVLRKIEPAQLARNGEVDRDAPYRMRCEMQRCHSCSIC